MVLLVPTHEISQLSVDCFLIRFVRDFCVIYLLNLIENSKKSKIGELYKSNKGGLKLFSNGYSYKRNKVVKNRHYWQCCLKNDEICKCNSMVITEINETNDQKHDIKKQAMTTIMNHNHSQNK